MKNILFFLLLFLIFTITSGECRQLKSPYKANKSFQTENLENGNTFYIVKHDLKNNIIVEYDNIYDIKIKNKTYFCYNKNCYDFNSFHYNKLTKTYTVDMIMDLMWCNAHQEYKSPHNNGYISHLIFKTKLHGNKITVTNKGYVVGDVIIDYKNGKVSSAHYNITALYKGKPKTIDNIKEFENILLDKDVPILLIKNLANN